MNTLGHLEQMLMNGEITDDEYKKKKAVYVETILQLFVKGIISKEELYEKLNQQLIKTIKKGQVKTCPFYFVVSAFSTVQ